MNGMNGYLDPGAPLRRHRNPITDAFEMMGSAPDIYNAAEGKAFHGLAQGYADIARSKLYGAQAEEVANRNNRAQELRGKFPLVFGGNPIPAQPQAGGQQSTVANSVQNYNAGVADTGIPYSEDGDDGNLSESQKYKKNLFNGISEALMGVKLGPMVDTPSSKASNFINRPEAIGERFLELPEPRPAPMTNDEIQQAMSAIPMNKAPQPTNQFNPADINHFIAVAISGDNPEKLAEMLHKGYLTGQQAVLMDKINNMAMSEADKVSAKMQIMGGKSLDLYDTSGEIRGRSENTLAEQRDAAARAEDAKAGRFQTESVSDLAHAENFGANTERTRKLVPLEADTEKARAENFRATAGKNEAHGGYYDAKTGSLGNGGMNEKDYLKAIEDEAKALRKSNLFRKGGPVPDEQIMAEAKRNVDQLIASRGTVRAQGSIGSVVEPPAGAVEFLRKNPNMSIAFDAKYGAGAARKYLEGR